MANIVNDPFAPEYDKPCKNDNCTYHQENDRCWLNRLRYGECDKDKGLPTPEPQIDMQTACGKIDVREKLAEHAHEAWSGWMKYLFKKGRLFSSETGEWILPKWAVDRWTRQMNTPYEDLPEEEKASDREEADRMIEIMNQK